MSNRLLRLVESLRRLEDAGLIDKDSLVQHDNTVKTLEAMKRHLEGERDERGQRK